MTLPDLFASGKYTDFVLIDGVVFLLPGGFTIEPAPVETSTVKTMASGRKRRDLIRVGYKHKFAWATATQAIVSQLQAIFTLSASATVLKLYLRKEDPVSVNDYDVVTLSLVNPVTYKPKARPQGLFIYECSLEVE